MSIILKYIKVMIYSLDIPRAYQHSSRIEILSYISPPISHILDYCQPSFPLIIMFSFNSNYKTINTNQLLIELIPNSTVKWSSPPLYQDIISIFYPINFLSILSSSFTSVMTSLYQYQYDFNIKVLLLINSYPETMIGYAIVL